MNKGQIVSEWAVASLMALVLMIAMYGKMFYPTEELRYLDVGVSLFEMALLGCLILYRTRYEMWLLASGVFACWGGYSLFWFHAELPCSCMGAYFDLPNGLSLATNGIFYGACMGMTRWMGAPVGLWCGSFGGAVALSLFGFAFAKEIYAYII